MTLMAHGDLLVPQHLWTAWTWEPGVVAGLLAAAGWYAAGVRRLRREAGRARGLAWWAPWCFGAGLAAVALALCSPLDPLGETLFAAHMVQHLVLLLVAAPLLALGAAPFVLLWAFPLPLRRSLGAWWRRRTGLARATNALGSPAAAWVLSVGTLLFWHLPGPYRAALTLEGVHALEHVSFLASGAVFWWVVVRPDGYRRLNPGLGVLYVFTAGLPSGLLGALLTFAGRPLYAGQSAGAALWGLTPLQDQQLAGLIMWMPGGAVHLAAAAAFFVLWLGAEERKGAREAAVAVAAVLVLALVVPSCRPAGKPPLGEDSTRTPGPPEMAAESLPAGLPEPADIGLDPKRDRVAIPVSSENRVEFWSVPGT
jgi:cytochrome c oxidase assembly factor CtaG